MKMLFLILVASLFAGCGKNPEPSDVVGTWTNADGAQLIVQENGQFSGQALPRKIFLWPDKAEIQFSAPEHGRCGRDSPTGKRTCRSTKLMANPRVEACLFSSQEVVREPIFTGGQVRRAGTGINYKERQAPRLKRRVDPTLP
jgi:hypothetical protein